MSRLVNALKLLTIGDAAVRRNPWLYADAQKLLTHMEGADLRARREWTQARLAEVLWAARRSQYGRQVRGTQELQSWPLLSKATVQANPRAFRDHSQWLTATSTTGGTTGAPLRVSRSLRCIAFEQACLDRMMQMLGADGRAARCASLRTDAIKAPDDFQPPFWVSAAGGRRMLFSSSHLNAATVRSYAQALASFDPDVLLGYPTSLEALCVLLDRTGTKLHLRRVLCSSETLHSHVWQEAHRVLGCSLLDYYGQAERVALACATQPGTYRFVPGYAHVEFERVGSEQDHDLYEIVGTGLWNLSMPLVRYRTADLIRVPSAWGAAELEELALGMRTFSGVLGRSGDILLSPEGVQVTGLTYIYRDVPHVMRIQVIQESLHRVRILVLASDGYSPRDEQQLLANVRRRVPLSMDVEIVRTEALQRTRLGKTPFVVHSAAVKEQLRENRLQQGGSA